MTTEPTNQETTMITKETTMLMTEPELRRPRTWKIIDRGDVPQQGARSIEFDCICGMSADLPVLGLVIAQTGCGIPGELPNVIFDRGPQAMPREIQCRRCRRRFTTSAA
jgi:hypothetical protein